MELAAHQRIVASTGPAAGKITGINHLVMLCTDLDRSTRFYRDLLGMKVVRTQPDWREEYERQYFFQLANGELFSLYQSQKMTAPERPLVNSLWPEDDEPSQRPQKLDHLAFNVDSMDDLHWFQERLTAHGVPVSKVWVSEAGFLAGRIYFSDPDGNPLEIATFDAADPRWESFDDRAWLREEHPVPALFEEAQG
ncbi:VOC family protein [Pseudonocardia xishanensis]|uniref:VOC family protein n=1 Tax=Pseudonocardia xishanensis TaxID=630995 RepID=A0ABP8RJ67_9PSEU